MSSSKQFFYAFTNPLCIFKAKSKMKLITSLFILCFVVQNSFAQNQPPVIQSFQAAINFPGELMIFYDLIDNENDDVEITFRLSDDFGKTYSINTSNASGDVGYPVSPGLSKMIIWDYSNLDLVQGNYEVMLVADDHYQIDIQEIVDQVDSSRIRSDLEFIEGIRHRTAGNVHLQAIKDSIESHFSIHNLENENANWTWSGYNADNFIGRKKGLIDETATYIIDGHYDTVDDSPGADDNGSAIVGVMEALRVLAPYHFKKSIKFIAFDLEEEGLIGSLNYTNNGGIPAYENIEGVFNFEMIGYYDNSPNSQEFPTGFELLFPDAYNAVANDGFRGNFITNVGIHYAPELAESFENAATDYVPDLRVISILAPAQWQAITPDLGRSDHAAFWLNTIPALMLTDGANFRNPNYHTPNDTIGALSFTFMSNVVKATVAAVAELAEIQHSTFATTDVVITVNTEDVLDCEVNVFPNPNDEFLRISMEGCAITEKVKITLLQSTGAVVYEQLHEGRSPNIAIPIYDLSPGIYFLQLESGNKKMIKKVVVSK